MDSFLRGLRYPKSGEELLPLAEANRVPGRLVGALRAPPPREYGSQQEVMDQSRDLGHSID